MSDPLQIPFVPPASERMPEHFSETPIPGLLLVERPVMRDDRGDFWEVARIPDVGSALGRPFRVEQLNRSRNSNRGTLRGIHVADWEKLVAVIRGDAFVALVDLRVGSPTYGKVYTTMLGDSFSTTSIFVPAGFGNSYQTLSDKTDYLYAVSSVWGPGREVGIAWNDPQLAIRWPIEPPILSPKDSRNPTLESLLPDFRASIR
jgi:dTDP-4-dehydrorhamnose 3,5-epimerase